MLGVLNQLLDKIHTNFTNKIEAICLEKTVTYYIQAFLNSADKKRFKTVDVKIYDFNSFNLIRFQKSLQNLNKIKNFFLKCFQI